jgi:hypothetical protein
MAKIRRREFRKQEHHALHVNIRLQFTGEKPDEETVEDVFNRIHETGRVPKGWKFAIIRWTHSQSGSGGWREGNIRDLTRGQFQYVLQDMIDNGLRIGIVRKRGQADVWEIEIALEY